MRLGAGIEDLEKLGMLGRNNKVNREEQMEPGWVCESLSVS